MVAIKWIPAGIYHIVQILAASAVAVMAAILIRYGVAITELSWFQTSPTMDWSMGYLYSMVPLCGALMLVFSIEQIWSLIRGRARLQHGAAEEARQLADGKSHEVESKQ